MTRRALLVALLLLGCRAEPPAAPEADQARIVVTSARGVHRLTGRIARTETEQAQGLKFHAPLGADEGLLFAPYPPGGGAPREANFWMKDTPAALDILFIRPDGTIARIAADTVPFSEEPIPSGEPVSAILEIRAGRADELGIAEGDRVRWTVP